MKFTAFMSRTTQKIVRSADRSGDSESTPTHGNQK